MVSEYKAIAFHKIEANAKVDRRTINRATDITPDHPAILVMTDFKDTTPFSIQGTASINATNEKMIACGVRLLFVTDHNDNLLGLVTATDVLSEKPVKYMKEHGGQYNEIMAQDIMIPKHDLDVLYLSDVEKSSVGNIIEAMKDLKRQHALVVEKNEAGVEIIRGIFSTAQIGRQLNITIEPVVRANTFADVERAIVSA
ncbi:MAG: CBS domain-containing protein [Gammaproteobacteria bacterium]|nr:CBS domain-containing protein [Gammaproteobacteria bacterium]